MGNINSVELSGHLTRDAELKVTKSGYPVVTFGMAVNEKRKNSQTGVYDSIPNFFECVMYGKYGESLQPHMTKGAFLVIKGRLHYSEWDNQGQRRSKVEVVVEDIDGLGRSKPEYAQQQGRTDNYSAKAPSSPNSRPTLAQTELYDEEIPF